MRRRRGSGRCRRPRAGARRRRPRRRRSCPPAASRRARAPRRCPAPRPAARPCRRSGRRRCAPASRCPAPRPRARPRCAWPPAARPRRCPSRPPASTGAGVDQAPPTARAASTRKRPPWYCEKTAVIAPASSTATVAPPTFSDASVPASMRSVAWIVPPTTRAAHSARCVPSDCRKVTTPFAPPIAAAGADTSPVPTSSGVGAPHVPPENAEAQMRAWLPGLASTRCTHAAMARPSGATASAAVTTGPAPAPASMGAAGSHAACAGAERAASSAADARTARSDTLHKRRIGDLSVVRPPSLSAMDGPGSPLRTPGDGLRPGARTCNCTLRGGPGTARTTGVRFPAPLDACPP